MLMSALGISTPFYVLMDGNSRIGPKVLMLPSGVECSTIYGFSSKGLYEVFCTNSELALTPYPLVKDYLRSQAFAPGDGLNLVVVDAAGPHEPYLHAATMGAVLEAQEHRTAQVTAAYQLVFDQDANAYRVKKA